MNVVSLAAPSCCMPPATVVAGANTSGLAGVPSSAATAAFGVGGVRPRNDRLVGGVGLVGVTVSIWVAPITMPATAASFDR